MKQFDKVVPDSEDARLAKKEIKENLTNSLSDALYINESDVNNQSTKFKAITKYIDKKMLHELIELAESLPIPNYEVAITEEKIYIIPIEDCDKPVKVVIK